MQTSSLFDSTFLGLFAGKRTNNKRRRGTWRRRWWRSPEIKRHRAWIGSNSVQILRKQPTSVRSLPIESQNCRPLQRIHFAIKAKYLYATCILRNFSRRRRAVAVAALISWPLDVARTGDNIPLSSMKNACDTRASRSGRWNSSLICKEGSRHAIRNVDIYQKAALSTPYTPYTGIVP